MSCSDLALYLAYIVRFNFNTSPWKLAHQTHRSEINALKLKFLRYTSLSGRHKGHEHFALDLGIILAVPRE